MKMYLIVCHTVSCLRDSDAEMTRRRSQLLYCTVHAATAAVVRTRAADCKHKTRELQCRNAAVCV